MVSLREETPLKSFTFPTCFSVSKRGWFRGEWGRKLGAGVRTIQYPPCKI